jgi:hypothetical protein
VFSKITEECGEIRIYACSRDLKTIKSFTHGRVLFKTHADTVQFGGLEPVCFPAFSEHVRPGKELKFRLIGPEGEGRQSRSVTVRETQEGVLYSPGIARTAAKRPRDQGWVNRNYRFRAYLKHPGVTTDLSDHLSQGCDDLPQWIRQSIERQRRFWNRLVELCSQAREACTPVDGEAVRTFVGDTVRPALRGFNEIRRRTRESIPLPQSLNGVRPSAFALLRFGKHLRHLDKLGKPVPPGLADSIFAFAGTAKLDFTPIAEFQRRLPGIVARERLLPEQPTEEYVERDGQKANRIGWLSPRSLAEVSQLRGDLELRNWEWRPIATVFQAALRRRFSTKAKFFEGWPKHRSADSPDWAIHYFLNGASGDPAQLQGRGIRGLRLDSPLETAFTGHSTLVPGSRKGRRRLCRAEIGFRDTLTGEKRSFSFVVLLHREFPENAEIKQWKLVSNREGLWLCFVLQVRLPVLHLEGRTGAVHIGWSKKNDQVTVASIYAPSENAGEEFRNVVVDLAACPAVDELRAPFRVSMGSSRWGRRSSYWVSGQTGLRVDPFTSGSVQIRDTWEGIDRVMRWRDVGLNEWRKEIRSRVPEMPPSLDKGNADALFPFARSHGEAFPHSVIGEWEQVYAEITKLLAELFGRVSRRLEDGYWRTAHDICSFFRSRNISLIAIQGPILAGLARRTPGDDESKILSQARVYQHRVAPGKLLLSLETVAESYGMRILKVASYNISRKHSPTIGKCGYVNEEQAGPIGHCHGCGKQYDLEQNALRNMVDAARLEDPEIETSTQAGTPSVVLMRAGKQQSASKRKRTIDQIRR